MMSTSFSVGLDYAVSSDNTDLLDVNQDGHLSGDEFRMVPPGGREERR